MSGHSKWSTIKHKKAASDAKKGKEFTRASNLISLAAKAGGDPAMNPALALAIEKAKSVNMPKANIERAIKKGTGELGGSAIEETIYEGYGPEGVAILIESATDNKNRTVSEVRSTLTKHGGSMASAGSVSFIFKRQGQIEIEKSSPSLPEERIEEIIIDSGAIDFETEDGKILIYTDPKDLMKIKNNFEDNDLIVSSAEMVYIPTSEVTISEKEKIEKIIRLIDSLEELDDITNVYSNLNISDEVMKELG
ncbi:MAG: YebC/PmpR family DNA-binding transcriptional regulator [Patescibacteria group bacterium]|nr:YebC/PmpR family DNA-binding transcriptional regulator [Patescibacteria group bacterium]